MKPLTAGMFVRALFGVAIVALTLEIIVKVVQLELAMAAVLGIVLCAVLWCVRPAGIVRTLP